VKKRLSHPHVTILDRVFIATGTLSSLGLLAWWLVGYA